MTILILIRHASNDYIKEGRLAGWTAGVHINAQGQREADELARRLAHLPIEAIYSSPLERAVDTANAVSICLHLPVEIREGLGEGQVGEWTGKTIKELQDTETWRAMQKSPVGVKPPGGESIEEVQERMVREIDTISRAHPDGLVAIVSHADPLKAAISHYLAWDLNQFQRIAISPASVSVLAVDGEKSGLLLLNHTGDIPKFEKPKQTAPSEKASEDAESAKSESGKDKTMTEANLLYDLNPITR